MFINLIILLLAAQTQLASYMPYIAIIISFTGAFISYKALDNVITTSKNENAKKMASKSYVLDKVSKPETDIVILREDFKDYKKENDSDHEIIKNDITSHFDTRFDDFKDFMIELYKTKK